MLRVLFCTARRRPEKRLLMAGILGAQCSNDHRNGSAPGATASRGRPTPATSVEANSGAGRRSALAAPRSTTRPTTATGSWEPGGFRGRGPRSGLRSVSAGRTSRRPCAASTWTRSSPTSRANGSAPLRRRDQREGKPRFAEARGAADQHRARARREPRKRGWSAVIAPGVDAAQQRCVEVGDEQREQAIAAKCVMPTSDELVTSGTMRRNA